MTFTLETACAVQLRDGQPWITCDAQQWVAVHSELHSAGFIRFEWLTAVHLGANDCDVVSCVSTASMSDSVLLSSRALVQSLSSEHLSTRCEITSLVGVYPMADFHERETAQMYGVHFLGGSLLPAFQTDFAGYPLRRDYALTPRLETSWPGATEPDVQARRRPQLPPGVFQEWMQPSNEVGQEVNSG